MKKTILIFGLISGAISAVSMVATLPFTDRIGYDHGEVIGYTFIVLSFLLVFFGIRSYRQNVGHGQITFAQGFAVGMGITVISCLFYVVTWEILYFNFMPDFADKYAAYTLAKARAAGASPAAIQAKIAQMQRFKELYSHPLINAAMTFVEPFPIGLAITLLSAAVLRRRPASLSAPAVERVSSAS